ncbi:MAG: nuclear transport factor 2 family protein [Caulobacterales bacterium]
MTDSKRATKDEIINLEKSYWDAMKKKDGGKTAELSAKTSLVTGAQGMMTIAKEKMGKMTESGDWTLESYKFDDIEVVTPLPDVAIIAYTVHQKCKINGKSQDIHAADSSTWIRGAAGWECHAHSESLLTDKTAA